MPNHLIFVRHGQSEANIINNADKDEHQHHAHEADVKARPDWMQRLSAQGVEQARTAGKWIEENLGGLNSFHGLYVSPFLRTRETAAYISEGTDATWVTDDRVIERDWGIFGTRTVDGQKQDFPDTYNFKEISPWYTRLDGGESMADVYGRFRDFQGTLHREEAGEKVIVVTHGEFINVAMYGLRRMLPEKWAEMDRNPSYTVKNCSIVHFTRVNPSNENEIHDKLNWYRIIYTNNPEQSPYGGEWQEIGEREHFNSEQLLAQLAFMPPLLER